MASDKRLQLIRLIHVAKRDLALDDDAYRAILRRIGNKESASELTLSKLEQVLEHMKRSGFKVRSKGKPSRPLAQDGEARKARALWLLLHELGAVTNPSEEALAAYAKRITGVDALQWLGGAKAERLIETLKKWAMRVLPKTVNQLVIQMDMTQLPSAERHELNLVLSQALTRKTFDPMLKAYNKLTEVGRGA
jgi:phage gp16-like protein